MIYGSVCSGIEAASAAWESLGWEPKWFSEIEEFPSAVLDHHWPTVPNLGDFTQIGEKDGPIELLVGGTPCQSFSVAGARAGLDDPRGNLTIEFARLAERLRPRWLVWENVPGVLSIDGGRTFGAFLGMLAECGYGFAYRVLDAQFFGVPQRRRRVFVVGYFGDWRPPAAVLFEHHSLSGHPAPRREKGQDLAKAVRASVGDRGTVDPDRDGIVVARSTGAGWYTEDGTASCRAVRRLTPRECERLQGFPDDFTLVPFKGRPAKDSPRYRAIGNSMAVPVMRWIGERIQMVEEIIAGLDAQDGAA